MAQFQAACKHASILKEHSDFASGSMVAAIYNVNRDVKKHGYLEWWELMPRWTAKYKFQQQLSKEEALKQYLIAMSKAQKEMKEDASGKE